MTIDYTVSVVGPLDYDTTWVLYDELGKALYGVVPLGTPPSTLVITLTVLPVSMKRRAKRTHIYTVNVPVIVV